MEVETVVEPNGCRFIWKIENATHCSFEKRLAIKSPSFVVDTLMKTKWSLQFNPTGDANVHKGLSTIWLTRNVDNGPDDIWVIFQLAFLNADGSVLFRKAGRVGASFRKGVTYPIEWINRERVFIAEREVFLPNDTLTIQCMIWNGMQVDLANLNRIYARTVLEVNRRSFIWTVEKFSTLRICNLNSFKDKLIDFDLAIQELPDQERAIEINLNSHEDELKYFSFKFSIVKSDGKKEYCRMFEFNDFETGILCTLLHTRKLLENRSLYLPNDVLTLDCEYATSRGNVLYEHCGYGKVTPQLKYEVLKNTNDHISKLESLNTSVLVDDLKSLYKEGIFSDIAFRTPTGFFATHKAILSARSPVFRKMFNTNMTEANSGQVNLTDLDDDTIGRMLLYLYTDSLEGLHLESACKLYEAADKYEIISLRNRCSAFLIANMQRTYACQILLLAHQHHDDNLKTAVIGYIVKQQKKFFNSQEFVQFKETHKDIALDLLYEKIIRE